MALQGKLKIASIPGAAGGFLGAKEDYGIIECAYEFNQSYDETGKPTSRPRGGTITFVMPTPEEGIPFFYNWMFNKSEMHDGTFTFFVYAKNNRKCVKYVSFMNAYCVSLREYFNDNDSRLMYTTVTISAEKISISGAVFDNAWK
jgi:hypothetical protein